MSYYQLIGLFIFSIGIVLRLIRLESVSLWYDEAFSWHLCKMPYDEMFVKIVRDTHPPLYYIVLRSWLYIFGDSVFAIRSLSVIAGVACIPATAWVVRAGSQKRPAPRVLEVIAAFLVATNGFLIYYSQQARMYSLATLLALVSTALLFEGIFNRSGWKFWVYYCLAGSALIYTHYFGMILLIGHACVIVTDFIFRRVSWIQTAHTDKLVLIRFCISILCITALYSPWCLVFINQFMHVQREFWTPHWSIYQPLDSVILFLAGRVERINRNLVTPQVDWRIRLTSLIFLFSVFCRARVLSDYLTRSALICVLVPLAVLSLVSVVGRGLWVTHSLQLVLCFILIAIPSAVFHHRFSRSIQSGFLVYVILGSMACCFAHFQWLNDFRRNGIVVAANVINVERTPSDVVIINPSRIHYSILYYLSNRNNCFTCGPPWEVFRGTSYRPDMALYTLPEPKYWLAHSELLNWRPGERVWVVEGNYPKTSWATVPDHWTLLSDRHFREWYPTDIRVRLYLIGKRSTD